MSCLQAHLLGFKTLGSLINLYGEQVQKFQENMLVQQNSPKKLRHLNSASNLLHLMYSSKNGKSTSEHDGQATHSKGNQLLFQ